jgi:hypothetical protein
LIWCWGYCNCFVNNCCCEGISKPDPVKLGMRIVKFSLSSRRN